VKKNTVGRRRRNSFFVSGVSRAKMVVLQIYGLSDEVSTAAAVVILGVAALWDNMFLRHLFLTITSVSCIWFINLFDYVSTIHACMPKIWSKASAYTILFSKCLLSYIRYHGIVHWICHEKVFTESLSLESLPSVLWHCWLDIRKSIRPVNNWVMRCWRGYLSEMRCKWFAYGPADATATPSSFGSLKSRLV